MGISPKKEVQSGTQNQVEFFDKELGLSFLSLIDFHMQLVSMDDQKLVRH